MKFVVVLSLILSAIHFVPNVAFAEMSGHHGGQDGNGGDPAELEFRQIVINIANWLKSDHGKDLQLPQGVDYAMYRKSMLAVASNYHIAFTEKRIYVDRIEKVCRNWNDDFGRQIKCNSERFALLPIDDKYRLIHHELAGLAGLENNRGSESNYEISNNISAYLETEVIKRLPTAPADPAAEALKKEMKFICDVIDQYDVKTFHTNPNNHQGIYADLIEASIDPGDSIYPIPTYLIQAYQKAGNPIPEHRFIHWAVHKTSECWLTANSGLFGTKETSIHVSPLCMAKTIMLARQVDQTSKTTGLP